MEINIEQIKKTIALGESENVEFKTSFNDEGLETIGAFSNANGGKLIVGVNDSGVLKGVQLGKKTIEDIANKIQSATDPRLQPSIKNCQLDDNVIIIIQVSQNSGTPVSVRGRFFKRVGKTNQRMSSDEIKQRLMLGMGKSWDLCSVANSTLKDINLDLLDNFTHSSNKGRKSIPESTSKDSLLRKLDLIIDGNLSRAALLLFGTNIPTNFPSAFVKVGKFRSLTTIVDDREFSGSLIQQLDEIMIWFKDRLTTEFVITGAPEREVRWEYPLSAIREAVINMLCHRDYSDGAHSQIRLYDDRLEFWNSGSLPSSLTPESLLVEHDSIPRNPKIAEIFFYMGLIERWGSGTVRISGHCCSIVK